MPAKDDMLRDFGAWCLKQLREPCPGDLDGCDAQDEAQRLGLLVEIECSGPCGEDCPCLEYHGEGPWTCLREVPR